jgi:hypothetical protein
LNGDGESTSEAIMNRTFLNIVAAACISMLTSGCIIVGGGSGQGRGDINLLWTFNGQTCMFVPQVQSVRVTIPGAQLQNNGIYPCMTANVAGINLRNFRGGSYEVTVDGLDSANRVIYSATVTVVVNGNVTASVNLIPTQAATGEVLASWTFPGNAPCAQVGDVATGRVVSRILVSVDGSQPSVVDCMRGNATAANPGAMVTVENLSPGPHVFDLIGQDSVGFSYVRATNTVTVTGGGAVAAQFQLNWTVGSLPLRWSLVNGSTTISCAQANVPFVFVNLRNQQTQRYVFADAQGNPTAGQQLPCLNTTINLQGAVFSFLEAANYEVYIQAPVMGSTAAYQSGRTGTIPVLQVQAGVFAQLPTMGQQIVLQ